MLSFLKPEIIFCVASKSMEMMTGSIGVENSCLSSDKSLILGEVKDILLIGVAVWLLSGKDLKDLVRCNSKCVL